MKKQIYIATSLTNHLQALALRDLFAEHGINLTYDWADEFQKSQGVDEDRKEIAKKEYEAVKNCDLFFMVTPGGRGAHFELGVAYAMDKPIVIWQSREFDDIAFFTLPNIHLFTDDQRAIKKALEFLT